MEMQSSHSLMCIDGQLQSSISPHYEKIMHYLSHGYTVIYIVENNSMQLVRNLSKVAFPIEDYIESGAMKIIDSDSFYSPSETKFDYNIILSQWSKVISSMPKKGYKGLVVMGMPHNAFFNKENQQKLVEYEEQVAKAYDNSFQVFCCYTKESIDKLPLGYLIRLLAAHQDIAVRQSKGNLDSTANLEGYDKNNSSNSDYPRYTPRLLDLIEEGLNKALGKETSALVLKTLKLVYKINKEDILTKPELFEEKIKRMFGETAEPILKIIAERIKTEIVISG